MSKESLESVEKGLELLRLGSAASDMALDSEIKARNVTYIHAGIELASYNCQVKLARIAKMQAMVAAAESTSNGGTPNSTAVFPGTCTIHTPSTLLQINIYIYRSIDRNYRSSWWFQPI